MLQKLPKYTGIIQFHDFLGNNLLQWSLVYPAINKFIEMLQFAHYARPNLVLAILRNPRRKIKKSLALCEFQFHEKQKFIQKSLKIFRKQQHPPMKTCLSCHQQIHRNSPICPICISSPITFMKSYYTMKHVFPVRKTTT